VSFWWFEGGFALSEVLLLIGGGIKRVRSEDLRNCSPKTSMEGKKMI
jgi:hypothetical protein